MKTTYSNFEWFSVVFVLNFDGKLFTLPFESYRIPQRDDTWCRFLFCDLLRFVFHFFPDINEKDFLGLNSEEINELPDYEDDEDPGMRQTTASAGGI